MADVLPDVAPEETVKERPPAPPRDPVRKWTFIVLAVVLVLVALQIVSDRTAPVSSQGTMELLILPVAPGVSGQVAEVMVSDNTIVEAGSPLFRIDPTPFQLAVDNAEAQLAASGQAVGASTAQVATAQSVLAERRANLVNVRAQTERTLELVERGVLSGSQGDDATSELARAEADVQAAEAELERAQAALGPEGADNPQIRAASANLATAQFNLEQTRAVSPVRAFVTNLKLATGQYAQAGQPVMTLIDLQGAWIVAYFRENQLGNVMAGDAVEIVLDVRPGEVWQGKVTGIGGGIMTVNQQANSGALVDLPKSGEWLTAPQRLPVRIEFDPPDQIPPGIRLGSQATVMVKADGYGVLGPLWWTYVRILSWLSYVY